MILAYDSSLTGPSPRSCSPLPTAWSSAAQVGPRRKAAAVAPVPHASASAEAAARSASLLA